MVKLSLQKISVLLVTTASILMASSAGGYGGAVYRAPLSASAWARGGASSANPELGLAFWNPAIAPRIPKFNLSFGGAVLPEGRGDGFLAGEGRVGRSRVGISALFLYRGVHDLGTQYDNEGNEMASGESFTNLNLRAGLGFAISKQFSLGLSMGWLYSSFPVDFAQGTVSYGKSTTIGGVSILSSWKLENGLNISAGVRDLFTASNWENESAGAGFVSSLVDTSLAPIVGGVSHTWNIANQTIRVDSDLNIYLMNSYFTGLDHPFSTWNNGVSWGVNDLIEFRIGVRDFLLTSTMFSDSKKYKLESVPKLSGGVGVNLGEYIGISSLRINYALSGTGIGAGINHVFDFLFEF